MFRLRVIAVCASLLGLAVPLHALPPASPGIQIGETSYETPTQESMARHTARAAGADIVHFAWPRWDRIPASPEDTEGRRFCYTSYSISAASIVSDCGFPIADPPPILGDPLIGSVGIAIDAGNHAHVAAHQREDPALPFGPWHLYFPIVGSGLHLDTGLGGSLPGPCPDAYGPRLAVSRNSDSKHMLALSNDIDCPATVLWYWRHNGTSWAGPVIIDSTGDFSYVVCDDPAGDNVAVVVHRDDQYGYRRVCYYESPTDGAGWIDGTEAKVRTAVNPLGYDPWLHLTAAYDHASALHIVWDEQYGSDQSPQSVLRHWSSASGEVRPVTAALWDASASNGVFNLNLSKLTLGIGDGSTPCGGGSNLNHLYVVYTRFDGYTPAEQGDTSALGYANGELCLNVSADGGHLWSPPINLTNTKTPNCHPGPADTLTGLPQYPDSICRSEHWASINEVVSDIDIFYISDLDAGGIAYGEGTWQLSPVMYLRLPGGTPDAPGLCPPSGPALAIGLPTPDSCGYHAPQDGAVSVTMTMMNTGNADLIGALEVTDFPGPAELSIAPDLNFGIPAGSGELTRIVTMTSNNAPPGQYDGQIAVSHNDATLPNPLPVNIRFTVAYCPCHGDPACDGTLDVRDVVATMGRAFRGEPGLYDDPCPAQLPNLDGRTDTNCDGTTDVLDVINMIDAAFRGATRTSRFCDVCGL